MTHPYAELEELEIWRVVDAEITNLEENHDIQLATSRPYVVGAICKRLIDDELVPHRQAPARPHSEGGPAGTAAVILRMAGVVGVLQTLLVMLAQAWMLTRNVEGSVRIGGAVAGLAGVLFFLISSILLIWAARPLGRIVARGL